MSGQRRLVSGGWWILTIFSALFFIFATVTTANVRKVKGMKQGDKGLENALIACVLLAAFEVAIYITLSAFVLLGRWCSAETQVGTWYGIVVALTFSLSWGFLPAGLVGQAYVNRAVNQWEKTAVWDAANTAQLRGAVGLAFLLAVLSFIYGWALLFCKKAFAHETRPSPQTYVAETGTTEPV